MANESGKIDMASLVQKEWTTMTFFHPVTHKEIPGLTMEVYSRDSQHFRSVEDQIQNKRYRKGRSQRGLNLDAAEIREDEIKLLAHGAIKSWAGPWELHAKPIPYSKENAVLLLSEVAFIKRQIDDYVGTDANFLES